MAGQVGIRGRSAKRDIPDCLYCDSSLRFDYLGAMVSYCNGDTATMVCGKCKARYSCEDGKILKVLSEPKK